MNLNTFANLFVEVESVQLTPTDKDRISRLIVDTIRKKDPARFKEINLPNTSPQTLRATVVVLTYEKGNAFARFMSAGLGQIRIESQVVLQDHGTGDALGRYEVTKTFAWGGIYGASTSIEDVEEGFAGAVADLLLGR